MAVIAFVNQKGGCAKSTTSVHFAYWLTRKKNKVLLIDADAQRSSSIWLESMETQIPFEVVQSPDDLLERIPELAQTCQHLIVDGPAGLSESTRAILFRADLAIVPCQPTGVDLRSASDAMRLIKQAQSVRSGPPKAAVFISRAVKGTKLLEEAIALLTKSEVPILKSVVYQRQIVADTFGQGATVWELSGKPAADASKEFERLFKEIMGLLP
ncbi:AAA family ATPase [Leptolyngbya sp. FACHB-671]|uniref:AAA family ATPase n=1 Tax=Leptolyngbya sp. FACHB-671 TaxID=2692812 RepID=UPI00168A0110|nr:AAA family ATPase [Leptolyngbya sp. FACHB-671]MBD2065952.1 AAA family ATPase [Leptolyngbya sp. FACHB-671]